MGSRKGQVPGLVGLGIKDDTRVFSVDHIVLNRRHITAVQLNSAGLLRGLGLLSSEIRARPASSMGAEESSIAVTS